MSFFTGANTIITEKSLLQGHGSVICVVAINMKVAVALPIYAKIVAMRGTSMNIDRQY